MKLKTKFKTKYTVTTDPCLMGRYTTYFDTNPKTSTRVPQKITCVVTPTVDPAILRLSTAYELLYGKPLSEEYRLKKTYTGTATYSLQEMNDGVEYNYNLGIKIAKLKALRKYYKDLGRITLFLYKSISCMTIEIFYAAMAAKDREEEMDSRIKVLIKD